jgi:O-antigen ligase
LRINSLNGINTRLQMTYKTHLISQKDTYLLLISWAIIGALLPVAIAIGYVLVTYLLVLRTGNLYKIFISILCILIFSDSRSSIFSFAETAKISLIVLTLIYLVFNYNNMAVKRNDLFRFFLPFLVFSLMTTLWASQPFIAFQKAISFGIIIFTVPLIYHNGRIDNRFFNREIVYFLFSILLVGFLIQFVSPSFTTLVGRYRGLLGNPNGLGIFLLVVFSVVYPILNRKEFHQNDRLFVWLLYIMFIGSLVFSASRSAIVAIGIFVILNRFRYFSNAAMLLIFIAFVFSYEVLLIQLPNVIMSFGLEEYFRLETLEEGSGRFVAWNFAWEHIQDRFFVGGGFSHSEYVFRSFGQRLSILGHQGNVHNSYLTLWLDTGLIGIILFTLGIVRAVYLALANSPYALALTLAILFSAYFESWLAASLNPFTILFVLSLTILSIPKQPPLISDETNS